MPLFRTTAQKDSPLRTGAGGGPRRGSAVVQEPESLRIEERRAFEGGLFAGLFIERFFCRYLCPLGAGLAIPAKLEIFDWLKRRPQCGRECRLCETKCTVGAIDPLGRINSNECVLCLRCQVIMTDSTQCPVLKRRARGSEGALA